VKSVREDELEVVVKLVKFFNHCNPKMSQMKMKKNKNSLIHEAAKFGRFNICKFLLQTGVDVNIKNLSGKTPLFFAAKCLKKDICQLLIEWGADVKSEDSSKEKPLDSMTHEYLKEELQKKADFWASVVPRVMNNEDGVLEKLVEWIESGQVNMIDVESRCISGSTLLHTAVHFNYLEAVQKLVKLRVDLNLRDFQMATPLHRAKGFRVLKFLLDSHASVNPCDLEGNTPLHVRCFGEKKEESAIDSVELLVNYDSDVTLRNNDQLLPIHCAAAQGRKDVIELLLEKKGSAIRNAISCESGDSPPSLSYLAFYNNHLMLAKWLVEEGFTFKLDESNQLLYRILTNQVKLDDTVGSVLMLCKNNASMDLAYENGDSLLHLVVRLEDSYEILELFNSLNVSCDAINDLGQTALFECVKLNKFHHFKLLTDQGAYLDHKDTSGQTCFDYIHNFDEWINSGLFDDKIIQRLKLYKLKHGRNFVKFVSTKLEHMSVKEKNNFKNRYIFSESIFQRNLMTDSQLKKHTITLKESQGN